MMNHEEFEFNGSGRPSGQSLISGDDRSIMDAHSPAWHTESDYESDFEYPEHEYGNSGRSSAAASRSGKNMTKCLGMTMSKTAKKVLVVICSLLGGLLIGVLFMLFVPRGDDARLGEMQEEVRVFKKRNKKLQKQLEESGASEATEAGVGSTSTSTSSKKEGGEGEGEGSGLMGKIGFGARRVSQATAAAVVSGVEVVKDKGPKIARRVSTAATQEWEDTHAARVSFMNTITPSKNTVVTKILPAAAVAGGAYFFLSETPMKVIKGLVGLIFTAGQYTFGGIKNVGHVLVSPLTLLSKVLGSGKKAPAKKA